MNTIYQTTISNKLTCDYLDFLINKVFALLPMFEESAISEEKKNSHTIYQKNLIQTINGNTELIKYDSYIVVDILSHLQSLFDISEHDDYKRHILKVCNLLSELKKEVADNGI